MRGKGRRQTWNTRHGKEVNFRVVTKLNPRQYVLQSAATGISIVGSAPKDLLFMGRAEDWDVAYIAKAPHHVSARECVTEEIISAVGRALPLRLAESQVVLLRGERSGDRDIRFLSRYFLKRSEEQLVHGAELVAAFLQADPEEVERTFGKGGKAEQTLYTVEALLDVLQDACRHGEFDAVRDGFGRMLAFDAIVGAKDRHAMNWGVVRNVLKSAPLRFSPLFDTARALFWDHSDSKFRTIDQRNDREGYIERYAEKSRPLIGCAGATRTRQVNHFEVIAVTMKSHSKEFRGSIPVVIRSFDPDATARMLYRDFGRMVSNVRLEYIDELLRFRHRRLLEILE